MSTSTPTAAQVPVETAPAVPASTAAKKGLTNRRASAVALIVAIVWTIPTFGLLVSSFRPEADVKSNGWWNFFTDPSLTLQNYRDVLSGGATGESLTTNLINTIVITVPG